MIEEMIEEDKNKATEESILLKKFNVKFFEFRPPIKVFHKW